MMGPIILASIVAAAIILERLWTLQTKRVLPAELTEKVWQLGRAKQINDKDIAALEQNSPLGKVLAAGLANRHRDARHPQGGHRGHRAPRRARARALHQHARHDRVAVAAAWACSARSLASSARSTRSQQPASATRRALSGGIAEALICHGGRPGVAIPATDLLPATCAAGSSGMVVDMEKEAMQLAQAIEAAAGVERAAGPAGSSGAAA